MHVRILNFCTHAPLRMQAARQRLGGMDFQLQVTARGLAAAQAAVADAETEAAERAAAAAEAAVVATAAGASSDSAQQHELCDGEEPGGSGGGGGAARQQQAQRRAAAELEAGVGALRSRVEALEAAAVAAEEAAEEAQAVLLDAEAAAAGLMTEEQGAARLEELRAVAEVGIGRDKAKLRFCMNGSSPVLLLWRNGAMCRAGHAPR